MKKMKYIEKFRERFTGCRVPSPGDGRYNEAIHILSQFVDANLCNVKVVVDVTRYDIEVRLETRLTYCTPTGASLEDGIFSRILDLEADVVDQVKRFGTRLDTLREESRRNQLRTDREEEAVTNTPCDLPDPGTHVECPKRDVSSDQVR